MTNKTRPELLMRAYEIALSIGDDELVSIVRELLMMEMRPSVTFGTLATSDLNHGFINTSGTKVGVLDASQIHVDGEGGANG